MCSYKSVIPKTFLEGRNSILRSCNRILMDVCKSGVIYWVGKERGTMTFGEKIQKERKEAGLSQEELAEQLGVSRQACRDNLDGGIGESLQENLVATTGDR